MRSKDTDDTDGTDDTDDTDGTDGTDGTDYTGSGCGTQANRTIRVISAIAPSAPSASSAGEPLPHVGEGLRNQLLCLRVQHAAADGCDRTAGHGLTAPAKLRLPAARVGDVGAGGEV